MRANPSVPKYCRASKGRAYTRIHGQWLPLGKYGTEESHERYRRVIAEYMETGTVPVWCQNSAQL